MDNCEIDQISFNKILEADEKFKTKTIEVEYLFSNNIYKDDPVNQWYYYRVPPERIPNWYRIRSKEMKTYSKWIKEREKMEIKTGSQRTDIDTYAEEPKASVFPKSGPIDPNIVNGIWDNRRGGIRFFYKRNFSWGDSAYTTNSVRIDLNAKSRPVPTFLAAYYRPFITIMNGRTFCVEDKEVRGNQIVFTGHYLRPSRKEKELIITVIGKDKITINAGKYLNSLLPRRENNPKNYYFRVPFDAPYEPLLPGEVSEQNG